MENRPLVKFIRNYIRDSSGVFSISSLVRISMTTCPTFTLLFVQNYSCLYNEKKITRWLEDMNFAPPCNILSIFSLVCILTRPAGSSKYSTTRKNIRRYFTAKHLIRSTWIFEKVAPEDLFIFILDSQSRENMQRAPSAGKHSNGAKSAKTCNGCQAREISCFPSSSVRRNA